MKFLIRCDSSKHIGFGHQMRCLSLAKTLRSKGHECLFVSKNLDGNISHLVIKNNFKLLKLDSNSEVENDIDALSQTKEFLKKEKPDWVIVDSYFLSEIWEQDIRELGFQLMAIDDIFRRHAADIVLDQNYHRAPRYPQKHNQKLFLGPRYTLLDPVFKNYTPKSWDQIREINSLTLFFGGTDPLKQNERFLKILNRILPSIKCHLVVGEKAQGHDEIKKIISEINIPISLHVQTEKISEILFESEFFLGAGGSITWERSYFGIPALCYSVAQNQEAIGISLDENECHFYGGKAAELSDLEIENQIKKLLFDVELRKIFHENSLNLQVSKGLDELILFLENFSKNWFSRVTN